MTLQEKFAIAQFVVMAAAGLFAWWTARINRQYERDREELREQLAELKEDMRVLEARIWAHATRLREMER